MAEPSDWEPLSEAQLTQHPGEIAVAPAPVAAPQPAVQPAVQPAAQPAPVVEDPHAELLLQQLQARLASAPPGRSLIAEADRREQRQLRQWRAAQAPELADCRPVQGPAATIAAPLEVQYEPGLHGRDPREEEAWFCELPAEERQRLQAVWASQRLQVGIAPVQRRNHNQRTTAAIVVFAAVVLAGSGERWIATLGAGVCCGICWRHAMPCRYRYPLIAFACLLLAQMLAWASDGGEGPRLLFMDSILLTALAALVGFDGEIRQTGGFDRK